MLQTTLNLCREEDVLCQIRWKCLQKLTKSVYMILNNDRTLGMQGKPIKLINKNGDAVNEDEGRPRVQRRPEARGGAHPVQEHSQPENMPECMMVGRACFGGLELVDELTLCMNKRLMVNRKQSVGRLSVS